MSAGNSVVYGFLYISYPCCGTCLFFYVVWVSLLSFATGSLAPDYEWKSIYMQEETGPEYPKTGDGNGRSRGIFADPPVRGLIYHAVLYLGVMLVILAVNLRIAPDNLWVQWIALLWGLLLFWNAWQVFSVRGKVQR